MSKWFLKGVIFIILFVVRTFLFDPEQGGPITGILYVGNRVLGMNVANEGSSAISIIISFIITLVVYYLIAEILTHLLVGIFGRKEKK